MEGLAHIAGISVAARPAWTERWPCAENELGARVLSAENLDHCPEVCLPSYRLRYPWMRESQVRARRVSFAVVVVWPRLVRPKLMSALRGHLLWAPLSEGWSTFARCSTHTPRRHRTVRRPPPPPPSSARDVVESPGKKACERSARLKRAEMHAMRRCPSTSHASFPGELRACVATAGMS